VTKELQFYEFANFKEIWKDEQKSSKKSAKNQKENNDFYL
jgi:hypothetical protein